MKAWTERPAEIANLLNPAFCGEIIRRVVLKYQTEKGKPLPFLFTFLILPLLTNKSVRERIPTQGSPKFHAWLEENPDCKIGMPSRIDQLSQITREAILFLTKHGCLDLDEEGNLKVMMVSKPSIINHDEQRHPHNFYKKAEKLGQWFSTSGGPSVVFASLGVKV